MQKIALQKLKKLAITLGWCILGIATWIVVSLLIDELTNGATCVRVDAHGICISAFLLPLFFLVVIMVNAPILFFLLGVLLLLYYLMKNESITLMSLFFIAAVILFLFIGLLVIRII